MCVWGGMVCVCVCGGGGVCVGGMVCVCVCGGWCVRKMADNTYIGRLVHFAKEPTWRLIIWHLRLQQ